MPHRLPRAAAIAVLVAAGTLVPSAPHAGEVPVTSLSNATLVYGDLLDQVALVYVYPQRAPMISSRVFAFASTESSQQGVGGVASPHHYGILVASQPYSRLSFRTNEELRLFQAALALRAGPVRTGLAVRASRAKDEITRTSEYGSNTTDDERGATLSYRETALGLGAGEGDLFVDVELDIRVEQLVSADIETRDSDARGTRIEADGGHRSGGALRAGIPWGEHAALRLAGSWHDRSFEVETETALRDTSGVIVSEEEIDGHLWIVGLSVQSREGAASLWRAWVSYQDEKGTTRWRYAETRIDDDLQQARAGVSLEHDAWWETRIYGGIRGTWESRSSTESRTSASGDRSIYVTETEGTSSAFAWGVSRTFGQLDLIASVSTNLNLSALFATLDAGFRF